MILAMGLSKALMNRLSPFKRQLTWICWMGGSAYVIVGYLYRHASDLEQHVAPNTFGRCIVDTCIVFTI